MDKAWIWATSERAGGARAVRTEPGRSKGTEAERVSCHGLWVARTTRVRSSLQGIEYPPGDLGRVPQTRVMTG